MKYFEKAGVSNKKWNLTVPRAKLTISKIIFQAANSKILSPNISLKGPKRKIRT
jgi:hypothetical protein